MADDLNAPQTNDAQFRFALSEDGMKPGVNRYFPPTGGEGPSLELLKRQVAEAGITLPVDEEAARHVVDAILDTGEIKRIPLVRGIPVQEPRDGSLMALGNLEFPVFPGDRFARLRKAQKARNGQTIDGKPLKPKGNFTPEFVEVAMGDNVEYDPVDDAYVSGVWGMVRFKDGVISVDQIPHISEDAITVTGTLHSRDFRGAPITPARIEKEMRDQGVVIDIDTDRLDGLLRKARKSGAPLTDQIIVAGRHPVPGRDGWLEYLVTTRDDAGTEDCCGRFNFRDRGSYPMVDPGQVIGRLHPPTPGEGGIDIYGKTIPAHGGRELFIHTGENVAVLEDKTTFQAKARGIVAVKDNVLAVTDCLLIPGNVNMESGNVDVENGSVKVLGSIHAGFRVSAPDHVVVNGSVESSTVTAGGNIEVSGGILMPDGGRITAGGDVTAGCAINAIIHAEGDVLIANDVTNSTIRCGGMFHATRGKGTVQGGEVLATKGVEVNEIGSELGVATVVGILIEHEEDEELRVERVKVQQAIDKIDSALGDDPPDVILERTEPAKLKAVAELLKHRRTLVKRDKSLGQELCRLAMARLEELAGIKIRVKRFLYPGAVVRIGSRSRTFKTRTEASNIYWDSETRSIVAR
eukprot:TRINITY_DN12512_c0_g1_i2.p1 TRINITY_DN12512_c0_g1~~TRINITY_DN12512_c0_g1_i2.p1  ORF type:complete len:634 (+),score=281.53 TRINITY_DN12512_c0_g1_i2:496-2397(+)